MQIDFFQKGIFDGKLFILRKNLGSLAQINQYFTFTD